MKTAFVIQIVQLCQYGTKSANTEFFSYWPTLFRPILAFRILFRFYIPVNNKIETLCHCRLMRQNGTEAKENKQMKLFHLKGKCSETRKLLKNHCLCKKNQIEERKRRLQCHIE